MGGVNPNHMTKAELANALYCRETDAYTIADRALNGDPIPYIERDGIDGKGNPTVRRVYLRSVVLAALDEWGRAAARRKAS
jgi:hypothetical protein